MPPPSTALPLLGVVLAGGLSRRMGQDKAQLRWQGQSLLQHAQSGLRAAGCEAVWVSGTADTVANTVVDRLVVDQVAAAGPVGALCSIAQALAVHWPGQAVEVLVTPVDLPCFTPALWQPLRAALAAAGEGASVAHVAHYRQHPLPFVWRWQQAQAPVLADFLQGLQAGESVSVRQCLDRLVALALPTDAAIEAGLANANTPEAWQALLARGGVVSHEVSRQ